MGFFQRELWIFFKIVKGGKFVVKCLFSTYIEVCSIFEFRKLKKPVGKNIFQHKTHQFQRKGEFIHGLLSPIKVLICVNTHIVNWMTTEHFHEEMVGTYPKQIPSIDEALEYDKDSKRLTSSDFVRPNVKRRKETGEQKVPKKIEKS